MSLIAQSIRARGQQITLTDAQGGARKVRGIVGRSSDEEALSVNPTAVPLLVVTLAAEDAVGVERGHTATFAGGSHDVNGVNNQGAVATLTLGGKLDEAA